MTSNNWLDKIPVDMNKTDRINLRAKNALNKLNHVTPHQWRGKVWQGILKSSVGRPYQISDKDFEEALSNL